MTVDSTVDREQDSSNGSVTMTELPDGRLIRVVGDLGPDTVPGLRTALAAARAAHTWIIVDLSMAAAVDRVALNTLVAGSYATRRGGRELLLVVPPDLRRTVVHAARLGSAFTTFPTVPRALSAATAGAGSRGGPARR